MGSGRYDDTVYKSSKRVRAAMGIDDFDYSAKASSSTPVHPSLDPRRINTKPLHKLESRDSAEHPNSNAVFVSFDVTGSNIDRAREAQIKMSELFDMLTRYLSDPQLLFAANDDYKVQGRRSIQIGEFESDNRADEQLRNILLTGDGGGNDGESYDLIIYAAAFKTIIDCYEKRHRKGYFFMYADEPIMTHIDPHEVKDIFGDSVNLEGKLPTQSVIKELQVRYNTFVIWPTGGYDHAREQYKAMFGKENVLILQHPNMICELIGSTIGLVEKKVTKEDAVKYLVEKGTGRKEAEQLTAAIGR
jgi:hypothetical protein